jgi:hypothetical protein
MSLCIVQHYKTEVHTLDANTEEQKGGGTNIHEAFFTSRVAEIYTCKSFTPSLSIKDIYTRRNAGLHHEARQSLSKFCSVWTPQVQKAQNTCH